MVGVRPSVDGRGFTLIEVIGALVIFSVGVIAASTLSRGLTEQLRDATLRSEATTLGLQTLDSLATQHVYGDFTAGSSGSNSVSIEGRSYTRSWNVTQPALRVRKVEVGVVGPGADPATFTGATFFVQSW